MAPPRDRSRSAHVLRRTCAPSAAPAGRARSATKNRGEAKPLDRALGLPRHLVEVATMHPSRRRWLLCALVPLVLVAACSAAPTPPSAPPATAMREPSEQKGVTMAQGTGTAASAPAPE